ncbi:MAG: hypothetical protein K6C96_06720 [Butyrivibrio sp.]|nr:hypothetical protein [Butyrivibrio sp.]
MGSEERYTYKFEKQGLPTESTENVMSNEVWIDVGNSLKMGCFDHHQGNGISSSFSAVLNHPEYLANLRKSFDAGEEIFVHMHEYPDIDCVSAFWLIRQYLELTADEFQALNSEGGVLSKLEEYVNSIDEGRNKEVSFPTIYAIFCKLGAGKPGNAHETHRTIADKGLKLIDFAVARLKENTDTDLFTTDFERELSQEFHDECDRIRQQDNEIYEKEKANGTIDIRNLNVWTHSHELKEVKTAIWNKVSEGHDGYAYARKEGCVVTAFPQYVRDDEGSFTKVMISVNRDIDKDGVYDLTPVASLIEQMEQIEEKRLFIETGKYRRDYSKCRADKSQFSGKPFSVTSDPWYISESGDVTDSPREFSLIRYEDILEVLRNNGSNVKKSLGISYKWNSDRNKSVYSDDYARNNIPLTYWEEDIRKWKDPESGAGAQMTEDAVRIIYAELDASLIRHNTEMLKAICMNVVGGTYHECCDEQFLFPDYRTCIYADLNYVIILTCSSGQSDLGEENALRLYLDTANGDSYRNSRLVKDIIELLDLRSSMLDISDDISKTAINDRKKIEKFNKRVLELSTQYQKVGIRNNYIEKSLCSFLIDKYELDRIRDSVTDEVSVLVGEARDRMVSKFNTLSAIAVPFILIATIFQMGFIKFKELISIDGVGASAVGWVIVAIIITVVTLYLLKGDGK